MEVFRIASAKWINHINGSGRAGRWNPNGIFVCYTAASRALACLEMAVHLSGEKLATPFCMATIHVPSHLPIKNIENLPENWIDFTQYYKTQSIGQNWVMDQETAILKVPSAIIKQEYNFLFNPQHVDFAQIKIIKVEDFAFDGRLL